MIIKANSWQYYVVNFNFPYETVGYCFYVIKGDIYIFVSKWIDVMNIAG
jgi:hypothetical protein